MSFEFINELSEARLFRNPTNLQDIKVSNVADNFFNAALALQIMHYEDPKKAKQYAQRTLSGGLDGWKSSGSDMNNMAQILMKPERYSDRVISDRTLSFPEMQFKGWLRNIANSRLDPTYDRKFFLALERQMRVSSPGLKNARRLVADWSRSTGSERATAIGRVARGLSYDLKGSDIASQFTKLAARKGAIAKDAGDSGGFPLWAKAAAAGAAGYYLGKKIASW